MAKKCSNSGDCYPGDYCENGNCCGPNAGNDCSGGILTTTIQNNRNNRMVRRGNRHLNASGFLGTGVSGFKVIWWSLGALLLLSVVSKGVGIYKQSKY